MYTGHTTQKNIGFGLKQLKNIIKPGLRNADQNTESQLRAIRNDIWHKPKSPEW